MKSKPHAIEMKLPPTITDLLELMQQKIKMEFCPLDTSPEDERLAYGSLDIIDIEHQLALDRMAATAERKLQ